jgi:hypothetical protein
VRTDEDRRRWDICLKTATAMSELCEPSRVADSQYVWFMTRSFYKSDIPTGDPPDSLDYEERGADADFGPGGSIAERDFEAALVDALTNLRHFARMHDLDFGAALEQSERHYRAEARSPWDAVPDD